jgi:lipoyl-dependent peroxiredoxin
MASDKSVKVTWRGDLATGKGTVDSSGSGAFEALDVSWPARTGSEDGVTSPEELIAAAHASCFSMALSNGLSGMGTPPESLAVSATVTFVPGSGITQSALDVVGVVPGMDDGAFREAAERAKDDCPVSMAMHGNVVMSVNARLAAS